MTRTWQIEQNFCGHCLAADKTSAQIEGRDDEGGGRVQEGEKVGSVPGWVSPGLGVQGTPVWQRVDGQAVQSWLVVPTTQLHLYLPEG